MNKIEEKIDAARIWGVGLPITALFCFMTYALYLAANGSVMAGVVLAFMLAGLLAAGIIFIVTWANNKDNAMIASIAKQDNNEIYHEMKMRAMAEHQMLRAGTAGAQYAQKAYEVEQKIAPQTQPTFSTGNAIIDID